MDFWLFFGPRFLFAWTGRHACICIHTAESQNVWGWKGPPKGKPFHVWVFSHFRIAGSIACFAEVNLQHWWPHLHLLATRTSPCVSLPCLCSTRSTDAQVIVWDLFTNESQSAAYCEIIGLGSRPILWLHEHLPLTSESYKMQNSKYVSQKWQVTLKYNRLSGLSTPVY